MSWLPLYPPSGWHGLTEHGLRRTIGAPGLFATACGASGA
jgi:hypothetical protein